MKRLRQLLALPRSSRRLLLEAAFLLWVTKLALLSISFESLRRKAARFFPPAAGGTPDWHTIRTVAWAVERAAAAVGGTCLTKAFVGEWLLRRRGQTVEVRVGVARDANGGLDAHAWLEVEGLTIIGAIDEMARFSTFPSLPGAP